MIILFIFHIALLVLVKGSSDCDGSRPILATVKQGVVRGTSMFSDKWKFFCAFKGIPYARPPVGRLRFRPPQPPASWDYTLSATKEGDACVHPSLFIPIMRGNEDCLYLNVYTPLLTPTDGELLDVMVFIPPGQFYFSSSSESLYGPQFLIDKNIVLVTFNYRLGAFGFLSTEDDEAPGNYGIKDQVAALKWIKENIKAFNGNPDSITLFGEEAGGASIHYHMMSPLTKGLFHRAISMDGTAIMPWARCTNPLELAKKQAYLMGCPTTSTKKLVDCLREASPLLINRSIYKLFAFWYMPSPGFAPVVEKKSERNPEPFITKDPVEAVASGDFQRIPWIIGGNTYSAAVFLVSVLNLKRLRDELKRELWPHLLMLPVSVAPENVFNVLNNISRFYDIDTHFQYPEQDSRTVMMMTDRYYNHGTHRTALLHSQAGHKTIYRYNFGYKGLFSNTLMNSLKNYGVSLGDELRYLFDVNIFTKRFRKFHVPKNSNDREVQELMLTLWTNFAKYGTPTPSKKIKAADSTDLLDKLEWLPMDSHKMRYLNIGQVNYTQLQSEYLNQLLGPVKLNMANRLNKERMEFWDSLPLNENVERKQGVTTEKLEVKSGTTRLSALMPLWLTLICSISSMYYLR